MLQFSIQHTFKSVDSKEYSLGLAQVDVIQGSHQSKDIDTYAWEYIEEIIKLKLALTPKWAP